MTVNPYLVPPATTQFAPAPPAPPAKVNAPAPAKRKTLKTRRRSRSLVSGRRNWPAPVNYVPAVDQAISTVLRPLLARFPRRRQNVATHPRILRQCLARRKTSNHDRSHS